MHTLQVLATWEGGLQETEGFFLPTFRRTADSGVHGGLNSDVETHREGWIHQLLRNETISLCWQWSGARVVTSVSLVVFITKLFFLFLVQYGLQFFSFFLKKEILWNVLFCFWLQPVFTHIHSIVPQTCEQRKNDLSLLLQLLFG